MKYNEHIEKSAQMLEQELGISRLRAENMIRGYLRRLPDNLDTIKSSLKMPETLRKELITLKKDCANLRLLLIFEAVQAFEAAIASGHKDTIPLHFENLKSAIGFYI